MYVIYIHGMQAPTVTHETYESAVAEANRLLLKSKAGAKATIAKLVSTITSKVVFEEVKH